MKKKFMAIFAAAVMMVSAMGITGCGASGSGNETSAKAEETAAGDKAETQDENKASSDDKIGVLYLIENGAFNDMKNGIVDELKANGYTNIDVQCAQGDATTLQTIAQNMADGSYKAVFTVATPATQAMVNQECDTPTFFCAVSAPVAAGVITDMEKPDKNATGTSNAIPIENIFEFAGKLTPDVKKWGFIYCTSEDNSVNTVKSAKDYCDKNGIGYDEVTVTNSSEVAQAAQTLADKVDAIFIPNDSVVHSAMTTVTEVTRDKKIPVYASSKTTVVSGAFATIAISDTEIGEITADMGLQYLKDGKAVTDIPSVVVPASETVINKTTMETLGITIPDDIKNSATFVDDESEN